MKKPRLTDILKTKKRKFEVIGRFLEGDNVTFYLLKEGENPAKWVEAQEVEKYIKKGVMVIE